MLILPYLDCLLCDHCARCFPCMSHIWCYSLGLWLSILTVRLWISKALSPTLIPKARLAGINLPLQEPHLLGHPSVSKAFFRFPSWNRWKQRGRKKSLLWAGTGLGKGGFRHIKLRGTKGLPRGWGAPLLLCLNESFENWVEGACWSQTGVLQVGTGVRGSSFLLRLVPPYGLLECEDQG